MAHRINKTRLYKDERRQQHIIGIGINKIQTGTLGLYLVIID
jgi:hypothetical protein